MNLLLLKVYDHKRVLSLGQVVINLSLGLSCYKKQQKKKKYWYNELYAPLKLTKKEILKK